MPKIAISYRRADREVIAGRIRDRLVLRYGEDAVFMDIDNIPYSKDFRVHIREAVVQSDILLVIVGQRGLDASRGGTRRIDSETDFVRFEVETALSNAVPISPSWPARQGCLVSRRSGIGSIERRRWSICGGKSRPVSTGPAARHIGAKIGVYPQEQLVAEKS